MLKEVGTSGQISLGKKYAGQLFDVVFYPDGRVELVPMKAVPTVREVPEVRKATVQTDASTAASVGHHVQEEAPPYRVGDGWLTPDRLARRKAAYERTPEELHAARNKWEVENKDAIEAMNERVAKIGSMARRIHEWKKAKGQAQSSVKASRSGNGTV